MTIKYFDFVCANGHRFEGSFGSIEEMQSQLASGLVRCPVCDTPEVTKLPSAAHLSSKKGEKAEAARLEVLEQIKERIMTRVREAADKAEDVGDAFAEETRRMKRGQSPRRLVKGRCSVKQAQELIEEGIDVMPVPESSGKTLN